MVKPHNKAPLWSTPAEVAKYDVKDGPFTTEKADGEAKIMYAEKGPAARPEDGGSPAMTFPQLMKLAAKRHGKEPALRVEDPLPPLVNGKAPPSKPHGQWKTWTYQQYHDDAERVAKACIHYGHKQHDAVSIFGFNSPQWVIAEVGAMFAGGKAAGVYPSDTPDQLAFKVKHSDASVAFLEGEPEMKKLQSIIDEVPYLKVIVAWSYTPGMDSIKRKDGSKVKVTTFEKFLAKGEKVADSVLAERAALIKPTHCCALIYTSGTTGEPKAVMVSHDNVIFECFSVEGALPLFCNTKSQDRILSYLPLSHVAGMLLDIIFPVYVTSQKAGWETVYYARPYDLKAGTLRDRLTCVRPTLFLGVPRVWEKIAEKIKALGASTKGTKKKIATWAKAKGLQYQTNLQIGGSGKKPAFYGMANKIVFSQIKQRLGLDACKHAITGAAPMTRETQEYFGQLGINVNDTYGMSESTAAVTMATAECHQWGTIGFPLPSVEIKIFKVEGTDMTKKVECPKANDIFAATDEEQGEICFRSRNTMMGYLANPKFGKEHVKMIQKKNADAVDVEGWLHSGDMGAMSRQGMIKITGRYKELIITAGGENVAPVPIEDELKRLCPALSNVMLIGDKRKFNIILVTLKAEGSTGELPGGDVLEGAAASLLPGVKTISAAMKSKAYTKLIENAITATNNNGKVCPSNASKIQKFTILPLDFSVATEELTATLKLKRGTVMTKNAAAIDSVYASKETYVAYA